MYRLCLLVVGFLILFVPNQAWPHSGDTFEAYSSVPPQIDGKDGSKEWANADHKEFHITNENGTHIGRISVQNDEENLYVKSVIKTDLVIEELARLLLKFDNDHKFTSTESLLPWITPNTIGDDASSLTYSNSSENLYYTDRFYSGSDWRPDRLDDGTDDGNAGFSSNGKFIYELRKPLCSKDVGNDFCIQTGDTIGFSMEFLTSSGNVFTWPQNKTNTPITYADIVIQEQSGSETQKSVFRLETSPSSREILPGEDVTVAVSAFQVKGEEKEIKISCDISRPRPNVPFCDFREDSIMPGETAILSIRTTEKISPGQKLVRITGSNGETPASAVINLDIKSTESDIPQKPPVAIISPVGPKPAGEEIRFSAEQSHDPDGEIVSYTWSFGDRTGKGTSIRESPLVTYTFEEKGEYTVRLIVEDDDGLTDTTTEKITVEPRFGIEMPELVAIIVGIVGAGVGIIGLRRMSRRH